MIKSFSIVVRKAGLSREEFEKHWREVHGPLVRKVPGIERYIQRRIRNLLSRHEPGVGVEIDGIAEVWYEDEAAMKRAWSSEEMAACRLDGPLFIGKVSTFIVEDETVI